MSVIIIVLVDYTVCNTNFKDDVKILLLSFKAYKLKMEFAAGEIEDLLDIGINTSVLSETWQPPRATNPVIAIEGLDGTGLYNQEQMREMEHLTLYNIEICISCIALVCVDLTRKVFEWHVDSADIC